MHLLSLLIDSPIAFIGAITPVEADFVLFCAVWLPWITVVWALAYLLYRPIPKKGILAPFQNMKSRMVQIFIVSLSALLAVMFSVLLKNHFQIVRPELLNFNFHPLLSLGDYGFPSSHAAVFSAIAASLFLIHRKAGSIAAVLALVIGAARIYAGVHTPLDILGGYLLGTACAAIVDYCVISLVSRRLHNGPISVE
jgi:membrane-associated phospholipid phosphatase